MKGSFYGMRGTQLSLTLIALVCTTIFIWTWEKTPLLTSLLPPHSQILKLSSDVIMGAPSVSSRTTEPYAKNISKSTERVATNERKEEHFDASPAKSSHEEANNNSGLIATPALEKDIPASVPKEKPIHKQMPERIPSRQAEISIDDVAPISAVNTSSSVTKKDNKVITLAGDQACNYAKGKWVIDDNRPLYSGFGCKQWLSGMWACRLTQRTDFVYEKLRWQPQNCKMEDFRASKFLKRMQDKTLAFIGDSLGRQQFQSLMCMLTDGQERPDVKDVGIEYGLVKARGAVRPDGWAYRFPDTNTTILYYWSASLCDLQPLNITNPNTDYAMHLDRPPAFLHRFIHRFHVLVLNTGHHWNRGKLRANRWVMHVGGVPNTNRKIAEIGGAKNLTIYSIANWVNWQLPKYPGLTAFFRTISPRHFVNGDWNTGGSCDNTTPLSVGKELSQDESSDPIVAGAVKGTKVNLLDITALSQLRDEGHISRYSIRASTGMQDCLHWCLPGVPDTWNEILLAQI
ncbi:protein trichome birefringence-like 16 [Malania oleifera]|uniref:protein trichome birefringence-like 16 n=1 Tax=Malania oleifera TaxID=397392 RepID=UPI0025AE5F0B|nr:protein trichome birefringence-like 16 [Malania oleifera]